MIFRKSKKTVKKGASGMDKFITGVIVGGAAASIFWVSRTKKWKKITNRIYDFLWNTMKWGVSIFWKVTIKVLSIFQKK